MIEEQRKLKIKLYQEEIENLNLRISKLEKHRNNLMSLVEKQSSLLEKENIKLSN